MALCPFENPADVYLVGHAEERRRGSWSWKLGREILQRIKRVFQIAAEFERRVIKGEFYLADFEAKAQASFKKPDKGREHRLAAKSITKLRRIFGAILPELFRWFCRSLVSTWRYCLVQKAFKRFLLATTFITVFVIWWWAGIMNGRPFHGWALSTTARLSWCSWNTQLIAVRIFLRCMGIQNVFVYTHDSIGQGEDGPTHQPVSKLANLRMTQNMIGLGVHVDAAGKLRWLGKQR